MPERPSASTNSAGLAVESWTLGPYRPAELRWHIRQGSVGVSASHLVAHARRGHGTEYDASICHLRRPFLGILLAGFFIPRIINLLASVYVLHVC